MLFKVLEKVTSIKIFENVSKINLKTMINCRVNYTDTPLFGETRLSTLNFEKMTLRSQICKIINTAPLFLFSFYLFF